ncbi:MAG: FtsX-like permease family protein [Defluviitaleaceae bacterium]|nr:FtsX-like permease family protein [Defluviitaleaceae bacterium]
MSIFRSGFLAVIRKPIKSTISLFMILCIAVLTTIGISASHTSYQAQLAAQNQIGAFFELMLNQDNYWERMNALIEQGYDLSFVHPPPASPITVYAPPNFQFMSLLLDDIRVLGEVDGISDYNVEALWHEMRAVNFNRVEGLFPRETDIPAVSLRGFRELSLMDFVQDGSITLTNGRWVQADDVNKLVISEELAELNNLAVGDYMIFETLPMVDLSMLAVMQRMGFTELPPMQIRGEVIGIYQNNRNIAFGAMPGIVSRSAENTIFTDLHFTEVGARDNDPFYYRAYFHVANIDEFNAVRARLLSADINWNRYTLIDRNETVEELSPAFAQLREIGQLLLGVTIVSSFLVLSLAFTFFLKGRSHEIGIWLSLGSSKPKIIFQILWENLLLAVVALAICFAIIPLIINGAESFLNNQIVAETSAVDQAEAAGIYIGSVGENAERVQLAVTADTLVMVFVAILALTTIATALAVIPTVRLKPREIFAKLS